MEEKYCKAGADSPASFFKRRDGELGRFPTTSVAALRDAEERSQVTPAKIDYIAFGPFHRAVELHFWLSLASGTFTFLRWMTTPVYKTGSSGQPTTA